MSERNYYVLCDDNCRFPSMTAEQIIAAIVEATGNTPTNIDDAFITKIRESNKNGVVSLWVGSTSEYNSIVADGALVEGCLYITTDGNAFEALYNAIQELREVLDENTQKVTQLGGLGGVLLTGKSANSDYAALESSPLAYDFFTICDNNGDNNVRIECLQKNWVNSHIIGYGYCSEETGEPVPVRLYIERDTDTPMYKASVTYYEGDLSGTRVPFTKLYGHKYIRG